MQGGNGMRKKIAVVGAGVAGIVTAHILQRRHDVCLYEKNDYVGGHTHTIVIDKGADQGTPVDTGFIVFNEKTYPNFLRFLAQLGVEKQKSSMSFSYYDQRTGLAYASATLDTLFAQRLNTCRASFWMMIFGILRFNHHAPQLLEQGRLHNLTMGQYLRKYRYSRHFTEKYLIPVCASVWSAPDVHMFDFPMETLARFLSNHGLLSIFHQPQWFTVKGGSHAYVKAFLKGFRGRVLPRTPIAAIRREKERVLVKTVDGGEEAYDEVVLACHADEALKLLAQPSDQEAELLSAWAYSENKTILHTDPAFLPPYPKVCASWNYVRTSSMEEGSPVMLSYYMNRLQNLTSRHQYCVTLNPRFPVAQDRVIREMIYTHPIYTPAAFAAQEGIRAINGRDNTYFCGAYLGYGFHEDAVKAGVDVARHFGMDL